MSFTAFMAAAFLAGSIPVGLVVAKIKGVDLRKTGSGNIGATNVLRSVGKKEALVTLLGDVVKGIIPVLLALRFFPDPLYAGLIGLSAIAGHDFSIFLKFRGGKGVATSLGVLAVYAPVAAAVTVIIWIAVFALTRYSSLGALAAFTLLPASIYVLDPVPGKVWISCCITLLVLIRHKENIRRLLRGEESRIRANP